MSDLVARLRGHVSDGVGGGVALCHEAADEIERLTAKFDAVKALVEPIAVNPNGLDALAAGERGMASAVLTILADTDEPKAGWVFGKCAREATRGYDDGQIPEHHRTCPKRTEAKEQGR